MVGNQTGHTGEDIAAEYLEKNGYEIVARNFHTRFGELDIVCKNGEFIVIAEVKTRAENAMGLGRESVTRAKQRKIVKSAMLYLQQNAFDLQPRFDVIEITTADMGVFEDVKIIHLKNAFDGGVVGGFI